MIMIHMWMPGIKPNWFSTRVTNVCNFWAISAVCLLDYYIEVFIFLNSSVRSDISEIFYFFLSNYSKFSFALLLRFYWTLYINNYLQYGSSSSLYVACISEAKGLIILMYIEWDCGPFREDISNKTKPPNSE